MANWGKVANATLMGIGPGIGIASDVSQGKGVIRSVAKGAIDFGVSDIVSGLVGTPAMLTYLGFQLAGLGYNAYKEHGQEKGRKVRRTIQDGAGVGAGFFDNEQAYTMRQRSLEAMGGHRGMVNNALGSEARRRASNIRY